MSRNSISSNKIYLDCYLKSMKAVVSTSFGIRCHKLAHQIRDFSRYNLGFPFASVY